MLVDPLCSLMCVVAVVDCEQFAVNITKILLLVDDGVIDTDIPGMSTNVFVLLDVKLPTSVLTVCLTCKIAPAPRLAAVTAPAAIISVSTMPSGKPPTETPVMTPVLPLSEIALIYLKPPPMKMRTGW